MKDDIAIKVEGVSKDFILPHLKPNSVKSIFTGFYKKNISAKNETQHALDNISFEIKKGEFFGIVGRNGSGKSTLLKILANIYQPTKGMVTTRGKLVPFIELGVGFNPELTGRENVYLNGAMLGFTTEQVESMYKDIVEFAELERFMDQKLKNYSSGMQVRLAFSMATRAEADILIVDEVLAVGDEDFQHKCFEYFKSLKKNKKTVVFVSHDMNAVREYCDKVVLIDGSKIIHSGDAETIAKEYSKLFTQTLNANSIGQKQNKWGNGGVDITSVNFTKKILKTEDEILGVVVTVKGLRDFSEQIISGITIKNESGQPVCGTNNKIIDQETVTLRKDQTVQFRWIVPNIFNEGTYTVEPAIIDGSNMEMCQWWDNAATFRVINKQKTPYIVAPKILLAVEES